MKNTNIIANLKDAKEIHVFYLDAHRETITTLRELLDLMDYCDRNDLCLKTFPDGKEWTNCDLFVCLNRNETEPEPKKGFFARLFNR